MFRSAIAIKSQPFIAGVVSTNIPTNKPTHASAVDDDLLFSQFIDWSQHEESGDVGNARLADETLHVDVFDGAPFPRLLREPELDFKSSICEAPQTNASNGITSLQQPISGSQIDYSGNNSSQGYLDGGLAQSPAAASSVPVDSIREDEEIIGFEMFRCENKCNGNLGGPHQCSRIQKALTISCNDCNLKFSKKHAFNRHYKTMHMQAGVRALLDCSFPGCKRVGTKGFNPARRDNILEHMRKVHKENIPKLKFRFR